MVAGARGMVGSAIVRALHLQGYQQILTPPSSVLNLISQDATNAYFQKYQPEYVFMAAARVGGIMANNTYRADFLYQNLMIISNVVHAAYEFGVKKLLNLGSSCIYPKLAPQPLKESYLLTGELEPTNEPYAIAKIAGIKLCESYRRQYGLNAISAMPTNLYGPNDNYDLNNSHVLPALIRKCHEAKMANQPQVIIWGDGSPRREFLHTDDLAEALIFLMKEYNEEMFLNIGWGEDLTIKELAELVADIVGFKGELVFDTSKPNGTPRKLLDTGAINALGWKPKIPLAEGIKMVYQDFVTHQSRYSMPKMKI